jgi:limonene-1,2-epoxide hydrolase
MADEHIDAVKRFFDRWDKSYEEFTGAFGDICNPNLRLEQSGLPTTNTVQEALGIIDAARQSIGMTTIGVDIVHIAEADNVVLGERIDHLKREDGTVIVSVPVVGVMEFEGDRIVRWREYFDPTEMLAMMQQG